MKKVEISIKDIIIAICHRWWIVLLGIVIGLGIGYISQKPIQTTIGPTYEEQMQIYEKKMEEYREEAVSIEEGYKSSERLTEAFTGVFINTTDYMKNSLLFRINPFNVKKVYKNIMLVIEDETQSISSGQLVDYIIDTAQSMSLHEAMGENYPEKIDESVLRELVDIKRINDSMLRVECYIIEDDRVDAYMIVDSVYNYLIKHEIDYPNQVRFSAEESDVYNIVDKELEAYISAIIINYSRNRSEYDKRIEIMARLKNELTQFEKGRKPVEPVAIENTHKTINTTKLIVGALVGGILAILSIVVLFLVKLPIQSVNQINNQLGIRCVGCVDNIQSTNVDKMEEYGLIYANIEQELLDMHNVLLIGNHVSSKELDTVTKGLNNVRKHKNLKFGAGDDIHSSTETVDLLNQSQGVILVAKKNKTTIRDTYKEYERVLYSSAKVVGYIFVND